MFLRDRTLGTTELVSLAQGGVQADWHSGGYTTVSDDGRYVAFVSSASNFVAGDTNDVPDVFVHDRASGTTTRVSVGIGGAQSDDGADIPAISGNGRFVVFRSYSRDLVPGDSNGRGDVFVHDLDATGFTLFCEPVTAGVASCPCSNPPAGAGRGCDNSEATGGATLSAAGKSYLSLDDLVLSTSDEISTTTSLVVQGDLGSAAGAPFGQGVACVGGNLLRLYVKQSSAGAITAPDVALGDPSVSARSAQLGDPIGAGQTRLYFVLYRDPQTLGGCAGTSTFNTTPAGEIVWSL